MQEQTPPQYPPQYPPSQYPPQQYPPQQYLPQQCIPPYSDQQNLPHKGATNPGQPAVTVIHQPQAVPPPTNAALAWISCCFFWPIAIVAVLRANEADRLIGLGDFEGAKKAGEAAKKWAIAAIIFAIAMSVIIGIIYAVLVAVFFSNPSNALLYYSTISENTKTDVKTD